VRLLYLIAAAASVLAGCSSETPQTSADLNVAYNLAAAAEAAYAGQPSANPSTSAQLMHLLSAAQAALLTWQNSSAPSDQTAANAAIAALVAYEASVAATPPLSMPGSH
jgi:hypothetical protein